MSCQDVGGYYIIFISSSLVIIRDIFKELPEIIQRFAEKIFDSEEDIFQRAMGL